MLENPIYHLNSFPQFYPRVADSSNFSSESSLNAQTLPAHIRAPHSPYSLHPRPPNDYHNSKPTISFPLLNSSRIALPLRLPLNYFCLDT